MNWTVPRKLWWVPGVLVLAALVYSYWSTLTVLVDQWLNNGDYSHGILVVPIAGYLIWERRKTLESIPVVSDWRALVLLFMAAGIWIVGELGAELFTTRVSMLLFVIGLTWLLYGAQVVKTLAFPLGFLFLMLPLPGFVYRNITFPLQLSASVGSVEILQALGISVFREGNVIDLGFTQLQVVEACSGLRFVLPLLTLGVLFAYFGQKTFWKRAVLVVATVPIAVFANMIRVAGTGVIGLYWGEEAAQGFFHSFSGWLVFMICVVIFLLLNLLLKFIPERKPARKQDRQKEERKEPAAKQGHGPRRIRWEATMVGVVMLLATPAAVGYLGDVPPLPLEKPLETFPMSFRGYTGTPSSMDEAMWEQVGGQDYVMINYDKEGRLPINFYVAYYEYQRKAGEFIHSPRLCLPGAGWYMEVNHEREIPVEGTDDTLKINELVITKGGAKQLVYFWYQGRDRNFTSEWAAKFYMVWDGIWRRRTDGALVRVIRPLPDKETLEAGRQALDPFAVAVFQELDAYLP